MVWQLEIYVLAKRKNQEAGWEPGHGSVLQATVSSRSGHAFPPCSASLTTFLLLVFLPVKPQRVMLCTMQLPHALQALTPQSTGNLKVRLVRYSMVNNCNSGNNDDCLYQIKWCSTAPLLQIRLSHMKRFKGTEENVKVF